MLKDDVEHNFPVSPVETAEVAQEGEQGEDREQGFEGALADARARVEAIEVANEADVFRKNGLLEALASASLTLNGDPENPQEQKGQYDAVIAYYGLEEAQKLYGGEESLSPAKEALRQQILKEQGYDIAQEEVVDVNALMDESKQNNPALYESLRAEVLRNKGLIVQEGKGFRGEALKRLEQKLVQGAANAEEALRETGSKVLKWVSEKKILSKGALVPARALALGMAGYAIFSAFNASESEASSFGQGHENEEASVQAFEQQNPEMVQVLEDAGLYREVPETSVSEQPREEQATQAGREALRETGQAHKETSENISEVVDRASGGVSELLENAQEYKEARSSLEDTSAQMETLADTLREQMRGGQASPEDVSKLRALYEKAQQTIDNFGEGPERSTLLLSGERAMEEARSLLSRAGIEMEAPVEASSEGKSHIDELRGIVNALKDVPYRSPEQNEQLALATGQLTEELESRLPEGIPGNPEEARATLKTLEEMMQLMERDLRAQVARAQEQGRSLSPDAQERAQEFADLYKQVELIRAQYAGPGMGSFYLEQTAPRTLERIEPYLNTTPEPHQEVSPAQETRAGAEGHGEATAGEGAQEAGEVEPDKEQLQQEIASLKAQQDRWLAVGNLEGAGQLQGEIERKEYQIALQEYQDAPRIDIEKPVGLLTDVERLQSLLSHPGMPEKDHKAFEGKLGILASQLLEEAPKEIERIRAIMDKPGVDEGTRAYGNSFIERYSKAMESAQEIVASQAENSGEAAPDKPMYVELGPSFEPVQLRLETKQTIGQVLDQLVEQAHISPEDAKDLYTMAKFRNKALGGLDSPVEPGASVRVSYDPAMKQIFYRIIRE